MALAIIRTQPAASAVTTALDASVSLRQGDDNVPGCPDIVFSIKTYEKIARDSENQIGDSILLPINLFFDTLVYAEQVEVYNLYRYAKKAITSMTVDNRREIQDDLQDKIFTTVQELNLAKRMIDFCQTDRFTYPNLSVAGTLPHHSPAKTFMLEDYIEITAISLMSKMMVPIWGEFIKELGVIEITNNQREKIAFDLIEPTLEEGAFERVYTKLVNTLAALVKERLKQTDKKSSVTTSFIVTHNGVDDQIFDSIVMAAIIVKRMATYESFTRLKDGNIPNAMVYIDDGIKRTADSKIQDMRNRLNTMPRRPLPQHDTEDNSSILDHASKTSKKPIDVPIFVVTAVDHWELPRLVVDTNTPVEVFNSAADYYNTNGFDVSPLCQAMIASFVGTRFGGSKCINYLPARLYQRIVILLQVYLIRQEMYDLAALVSAQSSQMPLDGPTNPVALRIQINYKTFGEYLQCQSLIKGYLHKPVHNFNKKKVGRKEEVDTIGFVNHISRMIDWLTRYGHSENMAPALWAFAGKQDVRPITGTPVVFDENTIKNLCKFYLMFHGGQRPF